MKDNSRLRERMKDERFLREVKGCVSMINEETLEKSLKRIGYLKDSERLPELQEGDNLPDDPRTLILLYLQSPLLDLRESIQTERASEKIKEKYGLDGILKDEPESVTLRDKIGEDKLREAYRELMDVMTRDKIKRVENFVRVGRNRVRSSLLKSIKIQLADYLLDGQDCGIIFDYMVSRGYKPQEAELDSEGRSAFERTSDIILNEIEALLLTCEMDEEFKRIVETEETLTSCQTFKDELFNYFTLPIVEANQMIGEILGGDGGSEEIKAIRKQCKEKIKELQEKVDVLRVKSNVSKSKFRDLVE